MKKIITILPVLILFQACSSIPNNKEFIAIVEEYRMAEDDYNSKRMFELSTENFQNKTILPRTLLILTLAMGFDNASKESQKKKPNHPYNMVYEKYKIDQIFKENNKDLDELCSLIPNRLGFVQDCFDIEKVLHRSKSLVKAKTIVDVKQENNRVVILEKRILDSNEIFYLHYFLVNKNGNWLLDEIKRTENL